jgi:hypothetical protein
MRVPRRRRPRPRGSRNEPIGDSSCRLTAVRQMAPRNSNRAAPFTLVTAKGAHGVSKKRQSAPLDNFVVLQAAPLLWTTLRTREQLTCHPGLAPLMQPASRTWR